MMDTRPGRCRGRITTKVYVYNPGGRKEPSLYRRPGDRCLLGATVGRYCKHHAKRGAR